MSASTNMQSSNNTQNKGGKRQGQSPRKEPPADSEDPFAYQSQSRQRQPKQPEAADEPAPNQSVTAVQNDSNSKANQSGQSTLPVHPLHGPLGTLALYFSRLASMFRGEPE